MFKNFFLKICLYLINHFLFIFIEIRNLIFDFKIFKTYQSSIFTIIIGNNSLGGTGKSPFVKFLVEHLSKKYKIAVLSRGYSRTSNGLIEANINSYTYEIGDEAKDLLDEFGANIKIICSNSRKNGLKYIENNHKNLDLIIMDDGFQHRWVKPHFSIILEAFQIDFRKYNFKREPFYREYRADLIIQTKLPNDLEVSLPKFDFGVYQNYSFFNSQNKQLYFNSYIDLDARPHAAQITALADNDRIYYDIIKYFKIKPVVVFSDHYQYSRKDIEKVLKFETILTTTKDWIKIKELISIEEAKKFIIVKNKIDFKEKKEEFLEILTSKIDNFYQNLAKKA